MYNFGSPKVGNWKLAQMYDKSVPNSFRIVTDGDIVCGLPPTMSYFHIGTEVLIDSQGAGTIIIDPSFVERRLRARVSTSISVHAMSVYELGLERIFETSKLLFPGNSLSSELLPFDEAGSGEYSDLSFSDVFENLKTIRLQKSTFEPLGQDSIHPDIELSNSHQLDVSESLSGHHPHAEAPPSPHSPPLSSSDSHFTFIPSLKIFQRFRVNEDDMNEILVTKVPRRTHESRISSCLEEKEEKTTARSSRQESGSSSPSRPVGVRDRIDNQSRYDTE
jgi:hypothetical protein